MREVIAIVGPTGSGKSELAMSIAEMRGGEVLSCDSMQVYLELNVGTAKLEQSEMRVPHHGIDIARYAKPYSAAEFQKYARSVIDDCLERDVLTVACGGSGLYVRAALDVMDFPSGEQESNPLREKYETILVNEGAESLYSLLLESDPQAAAYVHPNNTKRVIRALEMAEGETRYSQQVQGFKTRTSFYPTIYLGLRHERATLYERVNARVDAMMDKGLLAEVEALYNSGLKDALTASQAIGYKELFDYLEGVLSLEEAVESIKMHTRRYAKRQMTWFNSDERIHWIDCDNLTSEQVCDAANRIIAVQSENL